MTERTHELSDVSPAKVTAGVSVLILLIPLVLAVCFGVFRFFSDPASRLIQRNGFDSLVQQFPQPLLQLSPQEDRMRIQEENRQTLQSYGWIDRNRNTVRIPIQRAIEMTAARGLPVFPTGDSK